MKRVWDDLGFVVWFVGLGYIAWWLVGAPERGLLTLPLQAIGLMAATIVAARLIVLAIRRWRAPLSTAASRTAAPDAAAEPPRHAPATPLPTVKPRSHFGLRNAPR